MQTATTTYHTPVLLKQSVEGLSVKNGGVYVDVTFGGGGHSAYITSLLENGHVYGFDQDPDAAINASKLDTSKFTLIASNFRYLQKYLRLHGVTRVDGILADLGVSSYQFDTAERGFSFRFDGPLDMRMNRNQELSAADVIQTYDASALQRVFGMYGEITNARQLAQAVLAARSLSPIRTTQALREVAWKCAKRNQEHKYLAQVFQALRIEVNQEMQALEDMLVQSRQVLKEGGRLSVITYHSLEDRMVKNYIKHGKLTGEAEKDVFGNTQVPFESVLRKPIVPDYNEQAQNSRSRSAKLRIAVRTQNP